MNFTINAILFLIKIYRLF